MCLYPRLMANPRFQPNQKNRGVIPPIPLHNGYPDQRVLWVPRPCGKCMECRKKKAREWTVRLTEDIRHHKNAKFITLTFSNEAFKNYTEIVRARQGSYNREAPIEGYYLDNQVATFATRKFLERWRRKYKKSLRHWLITELGHNGTENIHLHGLVWCDDVKEVDRIWNNGTFKNGFTFIGDSINDKIINYVNESTCGYITKYVSKMDIKHKTYTPVILTSAGIGRGYTERTDARLNKYKGPETEETYRTRSGHKIILPKYWRDKIYSDEEKELLWIHKLNKQERWVNGEKIDISDNMDVYWKVLEFHRKENKRLGYMGAGDKQEWNRAVYEREIRKIKQQARIDAVGITDLHKKADKAMKKQGYRPPAGG